MSNKTGYTDDGYTDEPMKLGRIIPDFLPPPSELVLREDNVRVTLSLSRESVDFFKKAAKKQKVPYQRMIKALLDKYTKSINNQA